MASVILTDLTPEQAAEVASWFSESGEQALYDWCDIREVDKIMDGPTETLANGDVVIHCRVYGAKRTKS